MTWQEFYNDRYRSKREGGLSRSRSLRHAEHARIERIVLERYPVTPRCAVLDVGAGKADYLNFAQVTAVDISSEALASSPRPRRVRAEATSLPFDDGSFDVVIASQVLEHVPQWELALREMVRVTRSGGLVFVAVPNRYALMKRRYHSLERQIDLAGHVNEFREADLYFAMTSLGLGQVGTQGACYDVFWLLSALERSRWAAQCVPLMDRLPSGLIHQALLLDGRLRRRQLTGLSLEIWGLRP